MCVYLSSGSRLRLLLLLRSRRPPIILIPGGGGSDEFDEATPVQLLRIGLALRLAAAAVAAASTDANGLTEAAVGVAAAIFGEHFPLSPLQLAPPLPAITLGRTDHYTSRYTRRWRRRWRAKKAALEGDAEIGFSRGRDPPLPSSLSRVLLYMFGGCYPHFPETS
jgi:hypothetical protein